MLLQCLDNAFDIYGVLTSCMTYVFYAPEFQ